MLKRMFLLTWTIGLCMGGSCTITVRPDDDANDGDTSGGTSGTAHTTLDQASATIIIDQAVAGTEAKVTATIVDSRNRTLVLKNDQSVEVDGIALVGPDSSNQYTATVPVAQDLSYTVTVREPTIGVQNTSVDAPADFEITSPTEGGAASLSGFTLEWTEANNLLDVTIELSQTISGQTKLKTFGPVEDAGSYEFSADDLKGFVHGSNVTLTIQVTKSNTLKAIKGFKSGTLTVQVSATRTAQAKS